MKQLYQTIATLIVLLFSIWVGGYWTYQGAPKNNEPFTWYFIPAIITTIIFVVGSLITLLCINGEKLEKC